jgi:hypothetical protein
MVQILLNTDFVLWQRYGKNIFYENQSHKSLATATDAFITGAITLNPFISNLKVNLRKAGRIYETHTAPATNTMPTAISST